MARLNVTPDLFGRMGPGYLGLLCREIDLQDIRHHWPSAAIQATLCNLKRDPELKPDPFTEWDFIPGWEMEGEGPRAATFEEIAAVLGARIAK